MAGEGERKDDEYRIGEKYRQSPCKSKDREMETSGD